MTDTRFWHPFSDMATVRGSEFVLDRAEGVWVWDADGTRYLDATASLWYANVGHGRREIADAVHAQLLELDAYSCFGDMANPPAIELSARLASHAPMEDAKVFLTSGGGDSIDTAAKLARQHWIARGQSQKVHLIGRIGGYHGTHGYGTSIGGIEVNRTNWGPLAGEVSQVPYDDPAALEAQILRLGPDRVAAFFAEPVIGAGGVLPPPDGYFTQIAQVCERHDVLFVADAVICAFGRLGTWFGIERYDVEPDMVTFAKGVTSGYQPLGGVAVSGAVAAPFWDEPGNFVRHGPTYAGHPAACAAAMANLDLMEAEGLFARSLELEGVLAGALAPLADHPLVSEVRAGTGLLGAVELSRDALGAGLTVPELAMAARAEGVLLRPLGSAVAVSPPLIIEPEEIEVAVGAIGTALDHALDRHPALAGS